MFFVYHHNDFDGFATASIFADYLGELEGISLSEILFQTVDYDLKSKWPQYRLQHPNAVLDFLYHNEADWWFDHHESAFINEIVTKRPYQESEQKYWSTKFLSCPSLILAHLSRTNKEIVYRL